MVITINKIKVFFLLLFLATSSCTSSDQDHLKVSKKALNALGYADIFKNELSIACMRGQQHITPALCERINTIPKGFINDSAVPYFMEYVSKSDADKIIKFWESDSGKVILKKVIRDLKNRTAASLTKEERVIFENYNESPENKAAIKFIDDKAAEKAILKAVFEKYNY